MKIIATGKLCRYCNDPDTLCQKWIWVMKRSCMILTILLIATHLLIAGGVRAQDIETTRVTIGLKQEPLITGLKRIEQQSNFRFAYVETALVEFRALNIPSADRSVKETLLMMLSGTDLLYKVNRNSIAIYKKPKGSAVQQQDIYVTDTLLKGRVTGMDGAPLPGAVITITPLNLRTTADEQGYFSFTDIKPGSYRVLVSYVGFERGEQTAIVAAGKTATINFMLKGGTEMDEVEVISTGYESLPKERATGSFVHINNELFNRKIGPGILDRLDGITSGLLFDKRDNNLSGFSNMQIHGLYTLSSGISSPLIVVDNFPFEGDLNTLNPNDVESITVLKDATAASIWGAKAGNGVIVITTKRGNFNQKPTVFFNSNVTVGWKPDLYNLPIVSPADYVDLETFLFDRGAYNANINNRLTPISEAVQILLQRRNGQISAADSAMLLDALRQTDGRRDFEKYLYRNAVGQQYAVNVSGGSNVLKYYFSGGYDKNTNNLVGNQSDRLSIRSENTLTPIKKLQIRLGVTYTWTNGQNNNPGAYGSYRIGTRMLPVYALLADEQGNPMPVDVTYKHAYTDTVGGGRLLDWRYRPLEELENNNRNSNTQAFLGTLGIRYELTKSLHAEVSYQYQGAFGTTKNEYSLGTYFARDLINRYTNLNATTPSLRNPVPIGGILDLTNNRLRSHALRGQLNYTRTFSGKHDVNALMGSEIRQSTTAANSTRYYGYASDRLGSTNVDNVNLYPLIVGGTATVPVFSGLGLNEPLNRFVSWYGNASYMYAGKYLLSLSGRRDASNLFGVNTNNKWKPFWSAGMSWKISKENFYTSKLVPHLNLRVTYGYTGNVNNGYAAVTTISYLAASNQLVTNIPAASLRDLPNPELRWEKLRQFNIAVDFQLVNNILSGSIDYYRKLSTDVLGQKQLDPTVGASSYVINSAHIKGSGVDVQLNTKILSGKGLNWNATFLFNYSDFKVSRYLANQNLDMGFTTNGNVLIPVEGYNPFSLVSYAWAGLDPATGDPMGYDLDKQVSKNYNQITNQTPLKDQVISGPAIPKYFGSLLNTLSWKGVSLSANITYQFGHYFRNPSVSYASIISTGNIHRDYQNRWQQPGDEVRTNIPSFVYPNPANRDNFYLNAEINAQKAAHIRWEDVRLSYSPVVKGKAFFNNMQVYAFLSNLNVLLWKANNAGIDPVYVTGWVPPKTLSLGINKTF